MPPRYAPLPNPRSDPHAENEMEAAFDDSDDEQDLPLNRNTRNGGYQSLPNAEPTSLEDSHEHTDPIPGSYDFENVDYDYTRPPPGSPPGPSSRALPNEYGNTNGLIPSPPSVSTDAERTGGWFRRTAQAVLPSHYVQRLGLAPQIPTGAVGGGTSNDGVFANVTAKPSRAIRIQEGDETYLVPEETQKDAPPSYASAQADSVPPYWETTIVAPSSSNTPGEMIIDGLSTGSLFSFLWNMLVSISFQFVGFLLTYLLHTTHAAKLGSRAGLGVTLIQYGFAMRTRADDWVDSGNGEGQVDQWGLKAPADPKPSFETAAEAEDYYRNLNATASLMQVTPSPMPMETSPWQLGDVASEWLSFFLMTVGWFILLTSMLGFWRVKRWERSILSTQQRDPTPSTPTENQPLNDALIRRLEHTFGLRGLADGSLLRNGLGFPGTAQRGLIEEVDDEENVLSEPRGEYIIPIDLNDAEGTGRLARAYADEARLQRDLRAAGLL